LAFGFVLAAGSVPASAGGMLEAAELEHARANARAGGPVSERDAEFLERYGCSSGTRSRFCERLQYGHASAYRAERRRHRAYD
jgi:hypothetical protein